MRSFKFYLLLMQTAITAIKSNSEIETTTTMEIIKVFSLFDNFLVSRGLIPVELLSLPGTGVPVELLSLPVTGIPVELLKFVSTSFLELIRTLNEEE